MIGSARRKQEQLVLFLFSHSSFASVAPLRALPARMTRSGGREPRVPEGALVKLWRDDTCKTVKANYTAFP